MSLNFKGVYRFEEFQLNPARRTLLRDGQPVALSPKAFEVLTCLVQHAGEVVTKEQLLETVWPGAFVEESNLAQHISALRKAFTDRAGYIATIPGRGYQFTADVVETFTETRAPATLAGVDTSNGYLVQAVRERTHIVVEDTAKAFPLPHRRAWIWAVAAVIAGIFAGGIAWERLRHRPTEQIKLLVADFSNRTGDGAFDLVLKNALQIDLEQSPLLTIASTNQTREVLRSMGRQPDDPLVAGVAREVCERSSSQVVLNGSIVRVGETFVIMLDAVDCVSGKQLTNLDGRATSRNAVLPAMDEIAARMRHKLGESLHSIDSFDVPIVQATTTSLDALVAYSHGVRHTDAEAIPYFERAVQLDPKFAVAYDALGAAEFNLGNLNTSKQALIKAYELRQSTTAPEQFHIAEHYHELVQADLELSAKDYELWTRSYPRDRLVWALLTNTYTQMGQYSDAIRAGETALSIDPTYGFTYSVLARAYKRDSQFEAAEKVCQEAIARGVDSWGVHSILFQIAVYERDAATMAHESSYDHGKATEDMTIDNAAFAEATLGRLRSANRRMDEARSVALRSHQNDFAVQLEADWVELTRLLGDLKAARAIAVTIPTDLDDVSVQSGLNAALSGDTAYAQRVIEQQMRSTPASSTMVRKVRIPLLKAAIALQEGKPEQVSGILEPTRVYEMRDYYMPSLLGEAMLKLHRAKEAADAYQLILSHPGLDPVSPMYPLAHLGLARAYLLQNDATRSRKEYEAFFAAWKDGEPDVPVLLQAQREYKRLTKS